MNIITKNALNKSNLKSKENGEKRVMLAYDEWIVTKGNNIKSLAIKHKTDPAKLTKYILSKNHILTSFDINVFEKIDTEEKAYWLGFLYADGNVSKKSNNVELSLQLSDIDHLYKYKLFLKSKLSIRKDKIRCRFTSGNKKFKKDLENLGCVPAKSLIITFPIIPKHLTHHFIRGYFDGDGCITKNNKTSIWNTCSLCCGSRIFLEQLLDILYNAQIITKQNVYNIKNKNTKVFVLRDKNFISFMNYLYDDATIYLDRKYERYNNSIAVLRRDS